MLDNECPASLKRFMHQEGVNLKIFPRHLHCTNAAKRAIQTYKDHLVTGLSSCDPIFPLHLWYRLLQQATLTLNLLSAEAHINGALGFNRTPFVPLARRS